MTLMFKPATKQALKARIALEGPSGSGKTFTALTTAQALGKRIAVIDTERRSASLYADLFQFDTLELDRFAPDLLIDALAAAGTAGYDVVIVDSLSHFWMGADGMLEAVDKAAKRSGGGNNFAGWKEMRPIERRMVDAMLGYPGHLIATLRVKTEYVVEQNDRGKSVPRKVGLRPEQREGLEYEFTLVGALDLENTLVVSKSRCPALAGAVITKPTAEFGRTLLSWLDDGESAGESATALRDELLASPSATLDEIRVVRERARVAGLLGTAIVDEHGDTTTLNDWIVARGNAALSRSAVPATPAPTAAAEAPPAAPAQEEVPAERPVASQKAHRRMHALWGQLGYTTAQRDERMELTRQIIRRDITTSAELTPDEVQGVIDVLERRVQQQQQEGPPAQEAAPEPVRSGPSTVPQRRRITELLHAQGADTATAMLPLINAALHPVSVRSLRGLTEAQADQVIAHLTRDQVPA